MNGESYRLTNVRHGDALVDIRIEEGRFAEIDKGADADRGIDGAGRVIIPPLVEGHVHLDKTLMGGAWQPFAGGRTVAERIVAEKALRQRIDVPVTVRGGLLVEREIANGTGFMRTHVDIDAEWGLSNFEAVAALRERFRDRIAIQIVAFPQSGILASPGTEALLDRALAAGADLIGGLDPAAIDGDAVWHLDVVFGLADKHGKPVDIHLHERGALGIYELERIVERTVALGLEGHVTVSHAYCLADVDAVALARIAALLAKARVAILTSAPPAAMPPVLALREAGVLVFAGSDNIRDAWSPFGDGDMLHRAAIAARQQGLVTDDELATALDLVTVSAAKALGLDGYGIAVGNPADFVLVEAENISEAVAAHRGGRETYKRGRKVAGPD